MKISLYTYNLGFKSTLKTWKAAFKHREGLIISAQHNNVTAFGEIAPLPGFSQESAEEVRRLCITIKKEIPSFLKLKNTAQREEFYSQLGVIHPSLFFGLDTLWYDLNAKLNQKPVANFLFNNFREHVRCNTVINSSTIEDCLTQIKKYIDLGFVTFKIKVGFNSSHELSLIRAICKHFPDIKLRLDANRAWDYQQAKNFLSKVEPYQIEYCEEPLADLSDIEHLKSITNIPIAIDESIKNSEQAKAMIEKNIIDVLVIKPMLYGSFENIFVTNKLANAHNIEVVYTTALEGIIGRTMTSILAGGLGSSKYDHGLATARFFTKDLDGKTYDVNPVYRLNSDPGIGVAINTQMLTQID